MAYTLCCRGYRWHKSKCAVISDEDRNSVFGDVGFVHQWFGKTIKNRSGCKTIMSCDGEGERRSNIVFATENDTERAAFC